MSAKKLTSELIAHARTLVDGGRSMRDVAAALGVGKTQLAAALAPPRGAEDLGRPSARPARTEAATGQLAALEPIDAEADPLSIARALMARAATIPPDSPRAGEARALTKLIAALEKDRAKEETPEQAEERRRREAGETRHAILRYVEQAEREADERGVCAHCGAPRAVAGAA